MEIQLQNAKLFELSNSFDDRDGYYLISLKWSLINEEYITFVRKEALAYCYNLDWAGPMSKSNLLKKVIKDKTVIVPLSKIRSFLVKVNTDNKECFMLPNTDEVRKIIGFEDANLQLVV
ncbi:hypothetical protein [Flavobacterium degerlachei]|uniref:Uncharacterized protein n=1 Tax=Flavobacterium degerlachei TaxID=229203 RepID=A0A1H2YGT1_9FLAO|nr:hypothetical protein [Flavobacterium degerlachei]SDX04048.1 hypothetical protein SAMN05444338_106190 [Flavobacterium degerlachei]